MVTQTVNLDIPRIDTVPTTWRCTTPLPPASRQPRGGANRTLIDWLAVASRLPDSDHRYAVPWP